MNKRIKTENSTASRTPAKRTRGAVKKTTTKRPQRKRTAVLYTSNFSDSDDNFISSPSKSQKVNKTSKPRKISNHIYEISDTSDDDISEVNTVISVFSPGDVIVVEESCCPSTSKNNEIGNSISPSTSKGDSVSGTVKDDRIPSENTNSSIESLSSSIPDFVDNLINSCDEPDFLKSIRELNEETDKLLEVSRELLTESQVPTSATNLDDSLVYVCTKKYIGNVTKNKKPNNEDSRISKSEPSAAAETPEKQIKASCPICLESLGSTSVSATVCGHTFCTACIKDCVKKMKKCPTCRKNLTMKMIHPLFLF